MCRQCTVKLVSSNKYGSFTKSWTQQYSDRLFKYILIEGTDITLLNGAIIKDLTFDDNRKLKVLSIKGSKITILQTTHLKVFR